MGFSMSVFQIIFLLMSTFHIEVLNSSLVGKSIEGLPPGTLHNVIAFKTYSGGFFTKEYCLNIQAVKDNEPGELFIVEKESDCEASLMNGKKIFQLAFYNKWERYQPHLFFLRSCIFHLLFVLLK